MKKVNLKGWLANPIKFVEKKPGKKYIQAEFEEFLSLIFTGVSGLLLQFIFQFEFTMLIFIILVSIFLIHTAIFTSFLILNKALKKKRRKAVLYELIFILGLVIFSFFLGVIVRANWSFFEPNKQLDSDIGNPFTKGLLFIEVDYSADLRDKYPFISLIYWGYEVFKKIGCYAFFIIDDEIQEVSVKFNSSNMENYAELMNKTRDYSFAVHCLILHNSSIEGITNFMGYAPRNEYWSYAMANYSSPQFTGCMVFYDEILKSNIQNVIVNLIKVPIHEVGHLLNADHAQFGLMKQGECSLIELFFDPQAQLQMNLYNKWSVEKGFNIYSDSQNKA